MYILSLSYRISPATPAVLAFGVPKVVAVNATPAVRPVAVPVQFSICYLNHLKRVFLMLVLPVLVKIANTKFPCTGFITYYTG